MKAITIFERREIRSSWNENFKFCPDWYDFLYLVSGVVDDFILQLKSYPNAKQLDSSSILDCSVEKLKLILKDFLQLFDDCQQIASDQNKIDLIDYFTDAYNDLEKFYFKLKLGGKVT